MHQALSGVCPCAGEHLGESFPVLQQVFIGGLRDSSAEVRRTALQAVGAMVPWLDEQPHVNLLKDLVPLTIQVRSLDRLLLGNWCCGGVGAGLRDGSHDALAV